MLTGYRHGNASVTPLAGPFPASGIFVMRRDLQYEDFGGHISRQGTLGEYTINTISCMIRKLS